MVIANAVLDEEALVIAGCAERPVGHLDGREGLAGCSPWIADSQFPRPAAVGARDLRVLVQTVPRARLIDDPDRVVVGAVVLGTRDDLAGRVVREADAEIIGSDAAVQVVADPFQARDLVEREQGDGSGRIAIDPIARLVKRRLSVYDDP